VQGCGQGSSQPKLATWTHQLMTTACVEACTWALAQEQTAAAVSYLDQVPVGYLPDRAPAAAAAAAAINLRLFG
jgi:hypothetical protein